MPFRLAICTAVGYNGRHATSIRIQTLPHASAAQSLRGHLGDTAPSLQQRPCTAYRRLQTRAANYRLPRAAEPASHTQGGCATPVRCLLSGRAELSQTLAAHL